MVDLMESPHKASDLDSTASLWSRTKTKSGTWRNGEEGDPFFKDMGDKKLGFRRNDVSLAGELKELKSRLAFQELSETLTVQDAQAKAGKMEEDMRVLQMNLDERNGQLEVSAFAAQQYLKELETIKLKLATTQSIAEASTAAAHSAQFHCVALLKDLEVKDISLKEHEERVNSLAEQLALLQKEFSSRETSQDLMKSEVSRIEADITLALLNALENNESELTKVLEVFSSKNLEQINRHLNDKDEEIANLKEAIGLLSAEWMVKNKELEFQLEKQRKTNQDMKKRVLKLEFCLQEARAHTRKLQRMGERRGKAMKELQDQLLTKEQSAEKPVSDVKQKIWSRPSFKVFASMSMLIIVVFSKR